MFFRSKTSSSGGGHGFRGLSGPHMSSCSPRGITVLWSHVRIPCAPKSTGNILFFTDRVSPLLANVFVIFASFAFFIYWYASHAALTGSIISIYNTSAYRVVGHAVDGTLLCIIALLNVVRSRNARVCSQQSGSSGESAASVSPSTQIGFD